MYKSRTSRSRDPGLAVVLCGECLALVLRVHLGAAASCDNHNEFKLVDVFVEGMIPRSRQLELALGFQG